MIVRRMIPLFGFKGWSVLLFAILFLSSCSSTASQYKDLVGKPAPYTRLSMIDGDMKLLEEYQGRTVILVFWATWCARSKTLLKEIPDVISQLRRYDPLATVIMVDIEKNEKREEVKAFIKARGFEGLEQVFSGNEIYDEAFTAFRGELVPLLFAIDRNGMVVAAGEDLDPIKDYFKLK